MKLDITEKQSTKYAVELWVRDEQVRQACARPLPRLQPVRGTTNDTPVAIACFGPSLNDTWEQIRSFSTIFTCSGSHQYLIERGIVPTYHVEVDPRPHKVTLIGPPHEAVKYLIASTCHNDVFEHLRGYDVTLWHVFASEDDALRALPHGEWALTGGCSVGLRAMTIARFLGYTNLHIFGMDGCEGLTGKHAAAHPMQAKDHHELDYNGRTYYTTPGFLEAAKGTFHELNQMPDVRATFYGDGLVQAMAKDYVPAPVSKEKAMIGMVKPELISADYRLMNTQLHERNLAYGVGGGKYADIVQRIHNAINAESILDYGCGKGYLAKALPWPIWEYDPAIPGKDASPRPADLVVCTDVLEHIEPDKLHLVLDDLRRCTKKILFATIHTGAAKKTLPDGRNTHLIQQPKDWWKHALAPYFTTKIDVHGPLLQVVAEPKVIAGKVTVDVMVAA